MIDGRRWTVDGRRWTEKIKSVHRLPSTVSRLNLPLVKEEGNRPQPAGGGVVEFVFVACEADMVPKLVEVAFVTEIEGDIPDIQTGAAKPSDGKFLEVLVVVVEVQQVGGAVQEHMAFRASLEAKRTKAEPDHQRDVEVVIPFFENVLHDTGVFDVGYFPFYGVGVEVQFGLDDEIPDVSLEREAKMDAIVGVSEGEFQSFGAPLVEQVQLLVGNIGGA